MQGSRDVGGAPEHPRTRRQGYKEGLSVISAQCHREASQAKMRVRWLQLPQAGHSVGGVMGLGQPVESERR